MSAVLDYFNNSPIADAIDEAEVKSEALLLVGNNPHLEQSRCFFCRKLFNERNALTKHSKA
jgi:hypothetical protein